MGKVLKKYTMIPQELYVNRSADLQLKNIVDEMQRPGYVLVARQMGKTNLLFNAKRTLESGSRLFAYVDLSNTFIHERDCYRNIINNIIEPNENLFKSIESEINILRDNGLPSHNEYSKSLRIILNKFDGDIVIVLDEIDALRSADYSDNIFAQIRSNYFSRTNFPEFERLTYVLSGVIEPTELIKDRNKSPFNIGEKIYLDDFTKDEHDSFIRKSNLSIKPEISDKVFDWTNGNPRLTFDICSDIESFLIEKEDVTVDKIDDLIKRKYLTNYDIPPIDHIRELVKSSNLVRSATLSIQQGKAGDLSDEIKKKLYLYGIIDSNFDKDAVIKNRIIKLSLTEDWIKSIDKQVSGNFTYALSLYDRKEYTNTIEALREFLENSNPTDSESEVSNYYIGFSYYHLKNYQKASEYFNGAFNTEPYKSNTKSLLGVCMLALGRKDEGMMILKESILDKSKEFAYHNALLNLAINLDDSEDDKAFSMYEELYDATFDFQETKTYEINQLRTLSLFYQSDILLRKDDKEKAFDKIALALEYSGPSDSLYLIYLKYYLDKNTNEQLKNELVKTIIESELKFDDTGSYPFSFNEGLLVTFLNFVFDPLDPKLFEDLLNYAEKDLYKDKTNKYSLAYTSSYRSVNKDSILKYIIQFEENINNDLLIKIYKDLSTNSSSSDSDLFAYFDKYYLLFNQINNIESDDIYLFALVIRRCSDNNEIDKGLELCDAISDRLSNIEDVDLKLESVIIYYWYASLYFSNDNREKAIYYAEKTIQLIEASTSKSTSMLDEKGLKSISEQMVQIKISSIVNKPITIQRKYGRNEKIKVKYLDNTIVEGKYKKLEADILAERCRII